jgi:hypothetical protein
MKLALFLSLICLTSSPADESSPFLAGAYVVTSRQQQRYFFTMLPGSSSKNPSGICYKIDDDGKSFPIWKVQGWYSPSLFLTSDGIGLIRQMQIEVKGPLDHPAKPNGDAVFLQFYRNGKLVKEVYLKEVVNPEMIGRNDSYSPIWEVTHGDDNPRLLTRINDLLPDELVPQVTKETKGEEELLVIDTTQNERLFFRVTDGKMLIRWKITK